MANAKTEEAQVEETAVDTVEEQAQVEQFAAPIVPGTGDTGWRKWVAQQGGLLPPATPPTPFPGVGPIGDYVNPNQTTPSLYPLDPTQYPNMVPRTGASPYVPMNQNAVDPWAGWTVQKGTIRPVVPGVN